MIQDPGLNSQRLIMVVFDRGVTGDKFEMRIKSVGWVVQLREGESKIF